MYDSLIHGKFISEDTKMKKINKARMQQLLEKNPTAVIADMRSPVAYRDGHVAGAVNLPLKNFINKIMSMPKDTVIIAYSTSFDDVDLVQGFNYAEQLGFTKLYAAEYNSLKQHGSCDPSDRMRSRANRGTL